MKLTIVTTTLCITLATAGLMSNASGPAASGNGNRTGSPGSTGSCRSCHSGGGTLANAAISLKKKSDNSPANSHYNPGATYIVEVTAQHASLTNYGFQVTALDNNDNQAGAFQNAGTGKHMRTDRGIALVEHAQVIAQPGGLNTQFEWVAPASGKGAVTFYGMVNAVNLDGNTGGDAPSNTIAVILSEDPVGVNDIELANELKIYPNPANDELYVSGFRGTATVSVYSLSAKLMNITSSKGDQATVSLQGLAAGIYALKININGVSYNKLFIKQ